MDIMHNNDGQQQGETQVLLLDGQTIILQGDDTMSELNASDVLEQAVFQETRNASDAINSEELLTNTDDSNQYIAIFQTDNGMSQSVPLTFEQATALGFSVNDEDDLRSLDQSISFPTDNTFPYNQDLQFTEESHIVRPQIITSSPQESLIKDISLRLKLPQNVCNKVDLPAVVRPLSNTTPLKTIPKIQALPTTLATLPVSTASQPITSTASMVRVRNTQTPIVTQHDNPIDTSVVPRVATNTKKPLGSSENPIQLVQHGQTYHTMQPLSQDQLKQIATVLQQKQLDTSRNSKNVLYDSSTNTRIVYRVVYPEDLSLKKANTVKTTRKGRPARGQAKKNNEEEDISMDYGELSKFERDEKKKVIARTRSGRISRPPKHMMKDYKRIHHVDFAEPELDDSNGGYTDYNNLLETQPIDNNVYTTGNNMEIMSNNENLLNNALGSNHITTATANLLEGNNLLDDSTMNTNLLENSNLMSEATDMLCEPGTNNTNLLLSSSNSNLLVQSTSNNLLNTNLLVPTTSNNLLMPTQQSSHNLLGSNNNCVPMQAISTNNNNSNVLANNNEAGKKNVRNKNSRFRCPTCKKIYLGYRKLTKHFVLFPEHGSMENVPRGHTKKFDFNHKGRGKKQMLPANKQQLIDVLSTAKQSDIIEVAGPLLAKSINVWDFLLLKCATSTNSNCKLSAVLSQFKSLLTTARSEIARVLTDGHNETNLVHKVEIDDLSMANALEINCGTYNVADINDKKLEWNRNETQEPLVDYNVLENKQTRLWALDSSGEKSFLDDCEKPSDISLGSDTPIDEIVHAELKKTGIKDDFVTPPPVTQSYVSSNFASFPTNFPESVLDDLVATTSQQLSTPNSNDPENVVTSHDTRFNIDSHLDFLSQEFSPQN